ncbi:MAG: lipocalin-like domain-containing protein [Thermoplasmatota archaeon]
MHNVEPIQPKDDAFHGSKRVAAEWWYFDGVFSDNYSFHIGIRTFSRKKQGMALIFFELYHEDTIIFEKKKRFRFNQFHTSTDFPLVKINDKQVMGFDVIKYKENQEWIYRVTVSIDDCSADLSFSAITEGFKIETKKESWTVALPKARIQGEISYDGKTVSVDGIGYHDHNWNYRPSSVLTYGKGWYWGKIKSQSFNIVWANVLKRSGLQDLLAIVNVDGNGFYAVNPENIVFNANNFIRYKRRKIPTFFTFNFRDTVKKKQIEASLSIDVKHIHYSKVFIASYWRYHVGIKGKIVVDDTVENIDNLQIMEYLSMV